MPALTITAVDDTTDELTIVGHGLLTGDGPAATRNIDGVLPAPLAALTGYWIIRRDDDTIQLAASSADALAGTEIDLADVGSGTHLLEIGIPYRRARTYAPSSGGVAGARIHSADLNAIQDALTALNDRGDVLPIGPAGWQPLDGDGALFHLNGGFVELDAAGNARRALDVPVGRRITRIEVRCNRTGGTVDGVLIEVDASGTESTIAALSGTTSDNSTSGLLTLDAVYNHQVAADKWYQLRVGTSANGLQLIGARVTPDR